MPSLFVGCAHVAIESWGPVSPAQGIEPETGNGLVKILLAESCGDVLAKLEGIKRWRVQPTMICGQQWWSVQPWWEQDEEKKSESPREEERIAEDFQ